MDSDKALRFIDDILVQRGKRRLNDIQRAVFIGSWDDRAYKEIRRHYRLGCSDQYLAKDVGPELWKILGEVLGEPVTKKKLKGPIERAEAEQNGQPDPNNNGWHSPALGQNGSSPAAPIDAPPSISEPPPEKPSPVVEPDRSTRPPTRLDWGEVPDTSSFRGREKDLKELSAWLAFNCRLLAIIGIAGSGKTYLGVRLAQIMREQFEYVIWRSLSQSPSLEELLAELVSFISERQDTTCSLSRLIYHMHQKSCLIVLDGFDAVLQSGVHDGSYKPGYEDYAELLRQVGNTAHQSRMVITSQEKPRQIASAEGENNSVRSYLSDGIGEQASWNLITAKGDMFSGSEGGWNTLFRWCDGHPLAINVAATTIWEAFGGNVNEFLEHMQNDTIVRGELQEVLRRQFERLSRLEQTIVRCLTTHHEPAEVEDILRLIDQPLSRMQLVDGLQSLRRRSLISIEASRYSLHPLMLEFVQSQF